MLSYMLDLKPLRQIAYPALSARIGPHKARNRPDSGFIWDVLAGGIPLRKNLNLYPEKLPDYLYPDDIEFGTWPENRITGKYIHNSHDSQSSTDLYLKAMSQTFYALNFRAGGGTFFVTDTGYIAIAANTVREDDIVCSCLGCSRVAVLRPYEDESYRLITSAYVNDIMRYKGAWVQLCRRNW